MKIIIEGEPVAKKRHRCRCIAGHGQAYDEQASSEMPIVRALMLKAWNDAYNNPEKEAMLEASQIAQARSFEVHFTFHLGVAQSLSVGQKNAKFWGFTRCNCKPDFDNLIKFYCDCANGVLWPDDSMIDSGSFKKIFSEKPRTEIEIMSKNDLTMNDKVEGILKVFGPSLLREFLLDAAEISSISPSKIDQMAEILERGDKANALSTTAVLLSEFAERYEPYLHKIRKYDGVRNDLIHAENAMNNLNELNINQPIC